MKIQITTFLKISDNNLIHLITVFSLTDKIFPILILCAELCVNNHFAVQWFLIICSNKPIQTSENLFT